MTEHPVSEWPTMFQSVLDNWEVALHECPMGATSILIMDYLCNPRKLHADVLDFKHLEEAWGKIHATVPTLFVFGASVWQVPLLLHHLNEYIVGVGLVVPHSVDCLGPAGGSKPHEFIKAVKGYQLHRSEKKFMAVWRKLDKMLIELETVYSEASVAIRPFFAADSSHFCVPAMLYME